MKTCKFLIFAALIFGGCAGLPVLGELIGSRVSVNVPSELPLPDTMTLELGAAAGKVAGISNQFMSVLGQEGVEQKLGRTLKESAWTLRKAGAEAFRRQLEDSKLFGSVVYQGGNLGVSLGISRWGLSYNAGTRQLEPVLDLEAKLIAPGLGTVWSASRSVKDLAGPFLQKIGGLNIPALLAKPQGLNEALGSVAVELSRQLVDDLRKNPPHIP